MYHVKVIIFVGALGVSCRPTENRADCSSKVGRVVMHGVLVHLGMSPKFSMTMSVVVKFLACDDSPGAKSLSDAVLVWKQINPK